MCASRGQRLQSRLENGPIEPTFNPMKRFVISSAVVGLTFAAAAPTVAQVSTYPRYGVPGVGGAGDIQRYEMERLRQQAQESETLARQQSLQTRLTLMEMQARRQAAPATVPDSASPVLRSLERERAAREAATVRRQSTTEGVGQIDSWLDRQPR